VATLAAFYQLSSGTGTTVSVADSAAGEVLVVKVTHNGTAGGVTVSGGGLTWTQRINTAVASHGNVAIFTAVATGGAFTLTVGGGTTPRSAIVERWANAVLAASPVVATTSTSNRVALTTTAANSAISWAATDWNEPAIAGNTYQASNVAEYAFLASGSYTGWHGYLADAGAVGADTVGVATPAAASSQLIAAIEVLDQSTQA
jgi:hypothetical protein